jgi:hypothetical protein
MALSIEPTLIFRPSAPPRGVACTPESRTARQGSARRAGLAAGGSAVEGWRPDRGVFLRIPRSLGVGRGVSAALPFPADGGPAF